MESLKIKKSPHLAEVALKYRSNCTPEEMPVITSPGDAENLLREIWNEDTIQLKEEFVILLLNNAKKCLGWSKISSGGATATIVDPSTIFQVAILANATSIILAHNHPSGNAEASKADIQLTRRVMESGKLLGIQVDDHLILTADRYLSFKSENLL